MGVLHVVAGGQQGSEAKGHVTGWLATSEHVGAVARVAGPNAGHTAYKGNVGFSLRQIPIAAVTNPECRLLITAGSEIDPAVLHAEVVFLEGEGIPVRERLFIDPEATVIEQRHKDEETALIAAIGSTGKGIGAARAERLRRSAVVWQDYLKNNGNDLQLNMAPTAPQMYNMLAAGLDVIIEGTQGYGLGLHAGDYPFCTSSDCRAIDFLAMAGVSPWARDVELQVWLVFRTYPIRVAGNSGPMYRELTWEELADRTGGYIQPEHTTVTKKVRRIGEWDRELARCAMLANGAPSAHIHPVLTFVDYVFPELAGVSDRETLDAHTDLWPYLAEIENDIGAQLAAFSTGPATMVPLR